MSENAIQVEVSNAIAKLTVNRPQQMNALNSAVLGELEKAILALREPPVPRALLITGAGSKAFVAGADIAEMAAFGSEEAHALSRRGQGVFSMLEESPWVNIAAINGHCLGGGLELALACDVRFASENARFGFPEVGLGLQPGFGGTVRAVTAMGAQRASALILSGEPVDAATAERWGLVLAVLPPDRLLAHAEEFASKILQRGPRAVENAKRALRGAGFSGTLEAECFAELFSTVDQKEGTKAFLEKRRPHFVGK